MTLSIPLGEGGGAGARSSPSDLRVRYLELRVLRTWYRTNGWLGWSDFEAENREQLRRVVLMRWGARAALRADRAPGEFTIEYGR